MSRAKKKPAEQAPEPPEVDQTPEAEQIPEPPELLVGAKSIAQYVFRNERKARWVYERWRELGCFLWRGQIVGRPETINHQIVAREAAARAEETRHTKTSDELGGAVRGFQISEPGQVHDVE
jgi:hypothetical protein